MLRKIILKADRTVTIKNSLIIIERSKYLMVNLPQRKPKHSSPSVSNFICHDCLGLRSSIAQLQNDLALKRTECNELHSETESFQKEFEGAKNLQKFCS